MKKIIASTTFIVVFQLLSWAQTQNWIFGVSLQMHYAQARYVSENPMPKREFDSLHRGGIGAGLGIFLEHKLSEKWQLRLNPTVSFTGYKTILQDGWESRIMIGTIRKPQYITFYERIYLDIPLDFKYIINNDFYTSFGFTPNFILADAANVELYQEGKLSTTGKSALYTNSQTRKIGLSVQLGFGMERTFKQFKVDIEPRLQHFLTSHTHTTSVYDSQLWQIGLTVRFKGS